MKTAIYTLYQSRELQRMKFFVNNIYGQLNENRQLFVIINDIKCDQFSEFVYELNYVNVFCLGRNLGVASGRNFLIHEGLKRNFEFFVSCDNDIIFPNDYFIKLETNYQTLKAKDDSVGVVQPLLLDGRKLRGILSISENEKWKDLSERKFNLSCEELFGLILDELSIDGFIDSCYHTGISNIWNAHFGVAEKSITAFTDKSDQWKSVFGTYKYSLLADKQILKKYLLSKDEVRVTSTAGGITAFDADLIREVGLYNPKFDPFCFEDSEFGFRLHSLQRKNYLLPDVVCIHDVFLGDTNRTFHQAANIARLRGVELSTVGLEKKEKSILMEHSILNVWDVFAKKIKSEYGKNINDLKLNSDVFAFNYFVNFIFGYLSKNDRFPTFDSMRDVNIFSYLFDKLFGLNEKTDLKYEISAGIYFVIGRFYCRESASSQIFSLGGMNCRLENSEGESTRYFDFYTVVNKREHFVYDLNVDLQADSFCCNFSTSINFEKWLKSSHKYSPEFNNTMIRSKNYDFGSFSVEDIYPSPNAPISLIQSMVDHIEEYASLGGDIIQSVLRMLKSYADISYPSLATEKGVILNGKDQHKQNSTAKVSKVLIFTDSRGQHIPHGQTHKVFAETLAEYDDIDVTYYLCPMKWTTTLDFFEFIQNNDITMYDDVILFTGIVDWSPRPQRSAIDDLYNNEKQINLENWELNTKNYSKKIVNNKKRIFDELISEKAIAKHLNSPFKEIFEGNKTINMYSLTMALDNVIPELNKIENLIFINANRIVSGWEGDFKRGRPQNIDITHKYSDLFSNNLTNVDLVDLREWSQDDVKTFTCDNMHLTTQGNEYIENKLLEIIDRRSLYRHYPEITTFKEANSCFQNGEYSKACVAYCRLFDANPSFNLYLQSAFVACMTLKRMGENPPAFISRYLKRKI
jgi:hypothetical protein